MSLDGGAARHSAERESAHEAATEVARALLAAGHVAYFAGGCVRDALLGLEPKDFDIATSATPDEVKKVFPKARGVGEAFGVMLVRRAGHTIEVATFREDMAYHDGRRPSGVRFADARADAERRDFTMNGIFREPLTGTIVDFVQGQADLRAGILRAIGDPHARIAEDRLRMLRAVRFAARFGFAIEPATNAAVEAHASELAAVSRERIGDEVRRMMHHPSRARAASMMEDLGLARAIFEVESVRRPLLVRLSSLPPEALAVEALAAWMLDRLAGGAQSDLPRPSSLACAELARRVRGALVLSNDELTLFQAILDRREEMLGWDEARPLAARVRLASRLGIDEALHILTAEDFHLGNAWKQRFERECPERQLPRPILVGDDLIAAGYRPGSTFRVWLDAALDAQIEGQIASRDEALALVRRLADPASPP